MMLRILLVVFVSVLSTAGYGQTGSIKGNVKDAISGESIIGANILISGTSQGTVADLDGNFSISKVKAGTYNIIISFISYKTDTLKNISVYPDQTTVISHSLREDVKEIQEVVITGTRVTNTDVAVITEIKKADLVAVGISSQQITMSQDRDAAQILKRIPGVTVFNNRFVNVRGLSERYSTVMLNGVIAPSTEVDSRAFAFDLIPSNMIDRMLVYKSGAAELPGEFAGAVININTKSIVEENSLSINVQGGFRNATTFQDFGTYKGSATDRLGFDNGTRALPATFPQNNLREYSQDLSNPENVATLKAAGGSLLNQHTPTFKKASPDLRTTINFARTAYFGTKKLSNVTSISLANTYQTYDQNNYYYDQGTGDKRYYYHDQRYANTSRTGIISNFILELNPSNKIEFSNLLNQQGTSQVTLRNGTEYNVGQDVNNTSLNYWERGIYSGQLQGKHSLTDVFTLKWSAGYSSINSDQPDYRRFRRQRPEGQDNEFQLVVAPTASSFDGRFFSELNEKVYSHALNLEIKLNPDQEQEEKQAKILTGYYLSQTERNFDARWFSYRWFNGTDLSILSQPLEQIFSPANISTGEQPLFILEEGTNFSDSYTGKNTLIAGYAGIGLPFADKFRLSAGARVEDNHQRLNSFKTSGEPLVVDNPITSILPFVNLSFNVTKKALFRLAYSKTVNRPVFREIAEFNYYDFDRNANFYGNPQLDIAKIDNLDLRWELYPSKNENLTLGVFYKNFVNPIEVLNVGGSNLLYTFGNARSAQSYGVEVEARKSLEDFTTIGFVNKLSVNINAALIKSAVKFDLTDPLYATQDANRFMQGQSPYLVNAGLYYNDNETGWQINASYNVFGPRVFSAGDSDENPTQYEMPRDQVDLTVSKEIGSKWEFKLGVQDLLNQQYRIHQDENHDQKISNTDKPIFNYRPGQYINVGITYKINGR